MPLIGLAQAGANGFFDNEGYPNGAGWDEIPFPEVADEHAYALEIAGAGPCCRSIATATASCCRPAATCARRGDRASWSKTHGGEVMAKLLGRQTAQRIELKSFNPAFEDRSFAMADVAFIHRIIWASQ